MPEEVRWLRHLEVAVKVLVTVWDVRVCD